MQRAKDSCIRTGYRRARIRVFRLRPEVSRLRLRMLVWIRRPWFIQASAGATRRTAKSPLTVAGFARIQKITGNQNSGESCYTKKSDFAVPLRVPRRGSLDLVLPRHLSGILPLCRFIAEGELSSYRLLWVTIPQKIPLDGCLFGFAKTPYIGGLKLPHKS